jgi:hypothetical protein
MEMKRVIVALTSLMCFVSAMAQEEYESLLSESKVWTMMEKPSVNPEVYGDLRYIIETKLVGDTIINGIHFMQKYERKCKQGDEMPSTWTATNNFLGQDGSKIYQYDGWESISLDMDLSLNVGDKISYYDSYNYDDDHHDVLFEFIVTAVSDTIIVGSTDSKNRRCVYAQIEDYPSMTDAWIEGIGSIQKGISGVWLTMAVGSFLQLIKCTDGDTILYISDTFEDENISDIKSPGILREQPHAIYDLQGRRLPLNGCKQQQTPQKGVYIQNGKKYIVK